MKSQLGELLIHLAGGRPIGRHAMLGFLEFLILLGGFCWLARFLYRRFWGRLLPLLLREGRVSAKVLLLASFFLGVFALALLSESASKPGHPITTLMFLLFLSAAFCLFVWGMIRLVFPALLVGRLADCPPIGRLKDLLAERLSPGEQARLAAHLEGCTACQHRVEGLTAGQKSWTRVANKLSERPPSPGPALRKVMEELKESIEETTGGEPVFCADLPMGFLSPSDKPDQLGRLERYEVLAEVGRGGMGIVLKAFDPSLHRVVAIKVLAPQLATSGVARKRFLREAKAAAAVSHDHIVTIHAVDEANGLPYLVMQYIPGPSLQERIDKEGPLAEMTEVLRIGMQTASGLAAAHNHGIVHRDIKPANILLEEGVQRVKITDFGLARAMDDASLTQSGFIAGSPQYMAPEQARGEALDHRADLFSLGSVLYTLCTGRPPFRAANTLAVLRRVCDDAPRPIRETNPEVPDWFAAVVGKLMAKDAAERFQSAGEVEQVLGQHLAQLQGAAWTPPSPAPASANAEPGLPSSMTICPSCGVHLNVPERMVGSIVHCEECGKPFRVEEGSEEILVARAAPPPFGPRGGAIRRLPTWAGRMRRRVGKFLLFLVVAFVLFFVLLLVIQSMRDSRSMQTPASLATVRPADPFWNHTLTWFPAEASLFGAVDLKAFGSLKVGDEWTQTLLSLALPAEASQKLTAENLGRIKIDGVSLAYYEDPKHEKSRGIVQLEGLALDGRKRIIDFIRQSLSVKTSIEENTKSWLPSKPLRVSNPDLPCAIGIYDDNRVFLARSLDGKGKEPQSHLEVLAKMSSFDLANAFGPMAINHNVLSGYNPPWLKTALQEVSPNACGILMGEIPSEGRKHLKEVLELQTCPRTFVCSLWREGDGIGLFLRLNVDKAGDERTLREDLDKWRHKGLDVLKAGRPVLRKEPAALALLEQTLKTMRLNANPGRGCVEINVRIPGQTWKALGKLVKRAAQSREEGEKRR